MPQFFYLPSEIRAGIDRLFIGCPCVREKIWTLSVWEDEAALERFVGQQPHRQAMIRLRRDMGDSAFTRWKLDGAAVPPGWRAAMNQLPKHARTD